MTTAQQLIDTAYTHLGYKDAREALDGQDAAYALARLNDMLDSWNTQTLFMYTTSEVITTTSGQVISIGPSATINTPRPVRLPTGSFARIQGIDYPITWIDAAQYNSITLKDVPSTIPIYAHYEPGSPTGTVSFWPWQNTATEYHLLIDVQLTSFATLATNISLPQGYPRAIALSLAEELAPGLREPSPSLVRNAMNARRAIRQANTNVPVLQYADMMVSPYACYLAGI